MSSGDDVVTAVAIPSAEKRRDDRGRNKYYVYEVIITYSTRRKVRIWRRYSQFDALRTTLVRFLDDQYLPKLTKKLYLKRSSVHEVAVQRQPKLQRFLEQLLVLQDRKELAATLKFFLTPTGEDERRAQLPPPDGIVTFAPDGGEVAGLSGSLTHSGHASSGAGAGVATSRRPSDDVFVCEPSKARIICDFEATDPDELDCHQGDIVEVLTMFDDGWAEVSFKGRVGLIGQEFFQVIEQMTAKTPLEELCITERDYSTTLKDVRDNFFPRLRSLVSAPEAKAFFNNWAELIPIHDALELQLDVDSLQKDPSQLDTILSSAFCQMLDPYARYCAGLPQAQSLYEAKLRDKSFIHFEVSMPHLNKPTLNHVMRPFQRVLKYPLLLKEIAKFYPECDLSNASNKAEELAIAANQNMNAVTQSLGKLEISNPDGQSFQHVASVGSTDEDTLSREVSPHKQLPPVPPKPRHQSEDNNLTHAELPLKPPKPKARLSHSTSDLPIGVATDTEKVPLEHARAEHGIQVKQPLKPPAPPKKPTEPVEDICQHPKAQPPLKPPPPAAGPRPNSYESTADGPRGARPPPPAATPNSTQPAEANSESAKSAVVAGSKPLPLPKPTPTTKALKPSRAPKPVLPPKPTLINNQ